MIHAETIKAVQQLLQERGIDQRQQERLGDYVARGLDISPAEAERFLEALHDGCSVVEARSIAGIPEKPESQGLLNEIARAIGAGLGRITSQ